MALPHRPFQTYIGFGRVRLIPLDRAAHSPFAFQFFLEIPTIPIFCKFYVPDPRPRIRETRYILNFLVGTPYVEAVPSLKRHKLFILGVHPVRSPLSIPNLSDFIFSTIDIFRFPDRTHKCLCSYYNRREDSLHYSHSLQPFRVL